MDLPATHTVRRARIEHLTVFTDFAQNSLKAQRYHSLRAALRKRLRAEAGTPAAGIYIRRGSDGEARVLENEKAVEDAFRESGFRVVDCDHASAKEIAVAALNAPIVAGVEGSQLSHGIYAAADRATFLVLQPPARFAMAYKEFTDRVDMQFAFLVGEPSPRGFTIPPDDVKRMIDRITRTNAVVHT
jgi:capsular polysaccharide biosynthesis protein